MIVGRLIRLAFAVMLSLAPMVVRASAQGSSLTPDLLSKILDLIDRQGTDRDVPAWIANSLGLSIEGRVWPTRQVVVLVTGTEITHGIDISRGNDQDLLVVLRNSNNFVHLYRVRRDGKLVMARYYDLQTRQFTARDQSDAQHGLAAEFAYWTKFFEERRE